MGKYMKKSKITSDVTVVMESTTLGVRTRAKTLALAAADSSSYIQLRNRHIEKPPLLLNENNNKLLQQQQQKKQLRETQDSCFNKKLNSRATSRLTRSSVKGSRDCEEEEEVEGCFGKKGEMLALKCEADDFGVEVSFGENYLDSDSRDRSTRESTPCNLIKDSDATGTPCSTTGQASSTATNRRVRNNIQRSIPTTHEMEEFFTCAEQRQRRLFIEKYNFDVANDLPLPGRYEWVQVIP
ncbi:cyclin-dependent kinase inhibitor 3 [Ricinus communis]|uniref:Cyclin-dependent kinase inhibitor domain-containing protein n=1 Tax=Ricinus communis TaxID=3988 RepID=B9S531_RICCO|nr:cyclin-dependent kinase inhibitor 3 [Ricinus communis]EEF41251.1 conserved hypothetical protein [Ricinus communis]|eukprot:XP_002521100.1 cyclin-dependent kinase inhibitor 3 [Ricinus communis]